MVLPEKIQSENIERRASFKIIEGITKTKFFTLILGIQRIRHLYTILMHIFDVTSCAKIAIAVINKQNFPYSL
jgi:hypothetical protein